MTAYREVMVDDRVRVRGGIHVGDTGTVVQMHVGRATVRLDDGQHIVIVRAALERLPEKPGDHGLEDPT